MTESIVPVTGGVISGPNVQTATWFLGALTQVRVSGRQTGGAFVLDGELRVFAGEELRSCEISVSRWRSCGLR